MQGGNSMAGNIIEMGNHKYRLRYSKGSFNDRKYYSETIYASSMREAQKELSNFLVE